MSTLAEVRREIGSGSSSGGGGKSPHSDHHHHHPNQGLLSRDSSSYLANYNRTTTTTPSPDHRHKSSSTSASAAEQLRPSGSYSSEDYSPAGTRSIHHPNHHPNHHHHHHHHHRQQYKLVLEERQPSPDLHSNCSSTSPPAPAQVPAPAPAPPAPSTTKSNPSQPRPNSMLYSSSIINNNNINNSSNSARSPATSKLSPAFHENDPFLLLHNSSKKDVIESGENHSERLLPRRTAANNAFSPLLPSTTTNGWQQRDQNSCNNNNNNNTSHFNASFFSKRHDILLSALDFLSPTTPTNTTSAVLALSGASATTPTSTTNPSAANHQPKLRTHHSPHSQSLSPMPIGAEPLAQLLITLKEQNKSLIREIEDLRIKLADAEGDLKLVRCQMRSMSKNMDSLVLESNRDRLVDETILGDLEYYKEKVKMMERDIQSLLEEKDELAEERDELTLKNDRLNERLMASIRSSNSGNADGGNGANSFDHPSSSEALYLENRYLKEKIKGEEEERRLLMARLAKYKELMEEHQMGRNNDGGKKYGGSAVAADESIDDLTATTMAGTNIQLPGGRIMSAREVEELIAPESIHSMSVSKTNQMYLWNLLVACYEGLQKKDINLVRAKKTNRLLERRVEELMFGTSNHHYDLHEIYPDSYEHHHQRKPSTGGKIISGNQRPSSSKSPMKRRGVETTVASAAMMVGESISASTTARSTPSSLFLRENDALMTPDADLMTGGDCTDSVTIASSVSITTTVKETSEDEDGLEANDVDNTELSTTPSTSIDTRLHLLEKDLQALDYMHNTPRLPVHHQSAVSPNHTHHHHLHHHQSPLHQLHHHHQPFYDPPSSTYSTSNRDLSFGGEHHSSVITSHKSPTRGGLYN